MYVYILEVNLPNKQQTWQPQSKSPAVHFGLCFSTAENSDASNHFDYKSTLPTNCWYRGSGGTHQNTSGLPSNHLPLKHFLFNNMVCIVGKGRKATFLKSGSREFFLLGQWMWDTQQKETFKQNWIAEITWKWESEISNSTLPSIRRRLRTLQSQVALEMTATVHRCLKVTSFSQRWHW